MHNTDNRSTVTDIKPGAYVRVTPAMTVGGAKINNLDDPYEGTMGVLSGFSRPSGFAVIRVICWGKRSFHSSLLFMAQPENIEEIPQDVAYGLEAYVATDFGG